MNRTAIKRGDLRILVVEDEPLERWMLAEQLKAMGVGHVAEAGDGGDALRLVQTGHYDLVVTDLDLPVMDGIGFLRMFATQRGHCPVVIASALEEDLLRLSETALAESGCRLLAIVAKPVDFDRLEALVDQLGSTAAMPQPIAEAHLPIDPSEVRLALDKASFEPHFQPKIEVASGRMVAVESLARWRHNSRGWIPPGQFIPILEQHEAIVDFTMLMLTKVCASLRRFERQGLRLRAAINLSRSLFGRARVVERISEIAAEAGISPERLILEITETAVESDPGTMLASLARLKMKGFRLSIDDFGTGYSSLQALVRVPFDELKIDRSFVTGATGNPRSRIVLEATLQLAGRLGQTTVAEGVESREELRLLSSAGCHQVQGYFFSPALPESELPGWVERQAAVVD